MNGPTYQAYPQPAQKFSATEPVAERQTCGYIISVIGAIWGFLIIYSGLSACIFLDFQINYVFSALAGISLAGFHVMALSKPEYLKGKPGFMKLAPLLAFSFFDALSSIFTKIDLRPFRELGIEPPSFESTLINAIIGALIIVAISYAMYGSDDESGSCCLCFKPWIHKRPVMPPSFGQYPGYPPQAYPVQGFASQAYPQQPFYPQQQAAHPPQVYPVEQPQAKAGMV